MLFTDNLKYDLVGILISFVVVLLAWHKWKLGYWKRKGVAGPEPLLIVGNMKDLVLGKKSVGEVYTDIYFDLKPKGARYAGTYFFGTPQFAVWDLDMIKLILQTDFQHFHSHGVYYNEESDPLSANIFSLDGSKWRDIRFKLTPTFTSGKIKMMQKIMVLCADQFIRALEDSARNGPVEIKDISARFTTDVIGSCAFGIEVNSLKNPNAEFRVFGSKILDPSLRTVLKNLTTLVFPHDLLRFFNYSVLREEVTNFFFNVIDSSVKYREKNNIVRKDFLDLLINLKNENNNQEPGRTNSNGLTVKEIAAQSLIFILAGFETSSNTINFASYELAVNPKIQEKVRDEIKSVLKKHNNELTYEAIMEMDYLDKVVQETLRKYPALQFLFRKCTKEYMLGDDIHIEEGTFITIPVLGIHRDPEYFSDPEKFDPERFNEENKKKIPPFAYLPFGEGPRNCIGLRFGLLQTKIGLITIIRNFKLSLNKKTTSPLVFNKTALVSTTQDGLWLDLINISSN